jgi:hypothetical protein
VDVAGVGAGTGARPRMGGQSIRQRQRQRQRTSTDSSHLPFAGCYSFVAWYPARLLGYQAARLSLHSNDDGVFVVVEQVLKGWVWTEALACRCQGMRGLTSNLPTATSYQPEKSMTKKT